MIHATNSAFKFYVAVFGTGSDVGKSLVATALCRCLSNRSIQDRTSWLWRHRTGKTVQHVGPPFEKHVSVDRIVDLMIEKKMETVLKRQKISLQERIYEHC
jgi:hypothetical protein